MNCVVKGHYRKITYYVARQDISAMNLKCLLIFVFSVKTEDYFDNGIMEKIQNQLNAITSHTEIDINGSLSTITFHSTVSTCILVKCNNQSY